MRPISTNLSGSGRLNGGDGGSGGHSAGNFGKLLGKTTHGIGRLRTHRLPVRQTRAVKPKRFMACGRLGIVKSDTLDKSTITGAAGIRDHNVVKRTLFGATAR